MRLRNLRESIPGRFDLTVRDLFRLIPENAVVEIYDHTAHETLFKGDIRDSRAKSDEILDADVDVIGARGYNKFYVEIYTDYGAMFRR